MTKETMSPVEKLKFLLLCSEIKKSIGELDPIGEGAVAAVFEFGEDIHRDRAIEFSPQYLT